MYQRVGIVAVKYHYIHRSCVICNTNTTFRYVLFIVKGDDG